MNRRGVAVAAGHGVFLFDLVPISLRDREFDAWICRTADQRFILGRVRFNEDFTDACLTLSAALEVIETSISLDADQPEHLRMGEMIGRSIVKWKELSAAGECAA